MCCVQLVLAELKPDISACSDRQLTKMGAWGKGTLSNCELDKHQAASYASLPFVSVRF